VGTGNFHAGVRNFAEVAGNFDQVTLNSAEVTANSVKVASNFDAGRHNFTKVALNFVRVTLNFVKVTHNFELELRFRINSLCCIEIDRKLLWLLLVRLNLFHRGQKYFPLPLGEGAGPSGFDKFAGDPSSKKAGGCFPAFQFSPFADSLCPCEFCQASSPAAPCTSETISG
jgi:hypothetical protein